MNPPFPDNEVARLEALRRYHVLDTAAERAFDDIALLASTICGTPIGIMSLIDQDRQWFKAKVGVEGSETPRDQAFCAYTILEPKVLQVPDATLDPRFATNPLVTGEPRIRFYAGTPLITPDGFALGSLCVIDRQPRALKPEQKTALETLGRVVVTELELRRTCTDLATAMASLKSMHGLLPICAYCKGIRNDQGYWERVETYISSHSDAEFSHGICPDCSQKHFNKRAQASADQTRHIRRSEDPK
jgi:hypothetical protein